MSDKTEFRIKHPIQRKLLAFIILPLIIVYLIILFISYDLGKRNALYQTKQYLSELTGHHAAELDNLFLSVSYDAKSIVDTLKALPDVSESEISHLIRKKFQANNDLFGMALAYEPYLHASGKELYSPYFFRAGDEINSLDLGEQYNYPIYDWYQIPKMLKKPYWTEPYFDEGGGDELMITYSNPVIIDGSLLAVATADISLNKLGENIQKISIMAGYTFIVTRTGKFVYHPVDNYIMHESIFSLAQFYDRPEIRESAKDIIKGGSGIKEFEDFETREKNWLVYTPIKSCQWSFIAVIPEREIMKSVHKSLFYQSLLIVTGMLLIIGIIILVSYSITKPIKKLTLFAESVSEGKLDIEISDIKGSDEISRLSHIFNKMAGDLKSHISQLLIATKAKESAESELRIAREIQESLLPSIFPPFPDIKELELYALNIPAREVAGDFYDFFRLDDCRIALLIADVSGKGVPAGLYMVIARTLAKILCQKEGSTPDGVLTEANKILSQDNESCMFITLFLAYYNYCTGELVYANAGHKGSDILSPDGKRRELKGLKNMAMGISGTEIYNKGKDTVKKGEILVMYTDGVTEANAENNLFYGQDRFFNILNNHIDKGLDQILHEVCNDLSSFQKGNQFDDITLMLLRRA